MQTTTKKDLVERVSEKSKSVTKLIAQEVIQGFLDEIVGALANGERIELRDFGVFTPRDRAARKARNPKTGTVVEVPASKTVAFKLGKEFKLKLMAPASAPPAKS